MQRDAWEELLLSVAEVFEISADTAEICGEGLMFLERMAYRGFQEPARIILDFLRPFPQKESTWFLVTATALGLDNACCLLKKAGADLKWSDWRDFSAVHLAVQHNRTEAFSLQQAFRKIQYAPSTEDLENAIYAFKEMSPDYYVQRVEELLKDKQEWVQLYRAELSIGGHHTNNYAEASVRILKDVILQRTKAFNVAALVDYIADGWEKYLETRLCRFAYNRVSKPLLLYNDLVNRMPSEMAEKIIKIDDDTYHVPSSETGVATYEVTVSVGTCLCKAGAAGAFCKHQALVHHKFGKTFPNQPLITCADRYLMGQLALGHKCPSKVFFLGAKQNLQDIERELQESQMHHTWETSIPSKNMDVDEGEDAPAGEKEPESVKESEKCYQLYQEFLKKLDDMYKLGTQGNSGNLSKFFQSAVYNMNKITTENKAFEGFMRIAAGLKANVARSGKKIKVLHCERRKHHLTKGNAVVPSGRPMAITGGVKKKRRERKLAMSIAQNRPHIKKH